MQRYSRSKEAFSLIEMVVALAVMGIILAMTLVNFPKMRDQISLTIATRELALNIRKAQSYAIAVKEFDENFPINLCNSSYDAFAEQPVKYPPYGISLTKDIATDSLGRNSKTYFIFGDIRCAITRSLTQIFTTSYSQSEIVSTHLIQGGVSITDIRGGAGTALRSVDVVYQRPNPSVTLVGYDNSGTGAIYLRIEVTLSSSSGSTQKIVLTPSGQISIQ